MLNKVILIGNLTRDPELRYIPSGQAVASFGLATNRRWTDPSGEKKEETEFHEIVAWGKLAEICNQILSKGRRTYIEGRLRTRSWEAPDGTKRTRVEIIASDMKVLDYKPKEAEPAEVAEVAPEAVPSEEAVEELPTKETLGKTEKGAKSTPKKSEEKTEEKGDEEISLDDIPF